MQYHFGKIIKEFADQKNLKVKDLAELTGKTTQSIYDIFRKEDLGTDVLKQFAEALEIQIIDFFKYDLVKGSVNIVNQGIGTNLGKNSKQHFEQVSDCEKELEKANLEISYLKRENDLLRELSGKK